MTKTIVAGKAVTREGKEKKVRVRLPAMIDFNCEQCLQFLGSRMVRRASEVAEIEVQLQEGHVCTWGKVVPE